MISMRTVVRCSSSRNSFSSMCSPSPFALDPELFLQDLARDFLDRAARQMSELKGSIGQADQARHRVAEMLEDPPHLAVLPLLQGYRDPGVGALLALEPGAGRAIGNAVDCNTSR